MAYAAVLSLKHTIQSTEMKLVSDEDLCYLQSFIKTMRSLPSTNNRSVDLETQIKDAVSKFEDLINRRVSDRFLQEPESSVVDDDQSFKLIISQELLKVKQEINSFTKTLKTEEHYITDDQQQQQQQRQKQKKQSHSLAYNREKKIVGLDNELKKLQDWIFSGVTKRDVMSIVGMAGIGKTTFVEQVYYNPLVADHFKHCLFLPIGPHSQLKEILLLALDQLDVHENFAGYQLSNYVYKTLLGTKYLIVLDGVWNTRVWDQLKRVLPDNRNGSRVILTTQLLSLTRPIGGKVLQIPLLDDDQSWILLREIVFSYGVYVYRGGSLPKELEKIGRKIAKKCEGLPLAIIEVGKLLAEMERTVENWKAVAEKEDPLTITIDDDTPLSKALLLSYDMLPQYLKVCFLYMGVFPKSYEIPRSKLIELWASEGFLDPQNEGKSSLEETGDECLNELIARNVVLNTKLSSVDMKRTKTCRLHFTFRNICVSEAQSKKFFPIIKKFGERFPEDSIQNQQRLCFQNNVVLSIEQVRSWMESLPGVRSLLCFGPKQQYPVNVYLDFPLLKVLDALAIRFYEFPHRVLKLVHLRYLAITYDGDDIPSSIWHLWKLEVLIVRRHHIIKSSKQPPVYLPIEIWKLHELKHIECVGFDLPEPSGDEGSLVLEKLLTLSGVSARSCTRGVLARMPSLIKLGVRIESSREDEAFEALSFFGSDYFASLKEEFESFKCIVVDPSPRCRAVSSMVNFPKNIKKISLSGCGFPWENMTAIADLPNLLVLKLRWSAFCGPKWETTTTTTSYNEGIGFPKLKLLLMEDLDIEKWEAGHNEHFSMLERLIIRHCYKLKKIPPAIGDIPLLQMIQVDDCNPNVANSAREIQEKKSSWGNDSFRVRIHSSWDDNKPTHE